MNVLGLCPVVRVVPVLPEDQDPGEPCLFLFFCCCVWADVSRLFIPLKLQTSYVPVMVLKVLTGVSKTPWSKLDCPSRHLWQLPHWLNHPAEVMRTAFTVLALLQSGSASRHLVIRQSTGIRSWNDYQYLCLFNFPVPGHSKVFFSGQNAQQGALCRRSVS